MNRIVSVSLGSSTRDHVVETEISGEVFQLKRIGTDGDLQRAKKLFTELDGKVDALGMGGIDLHIYAENSRYKLKDAAKLIANVKKTPVVDGSGLKMTLEKKVISDLKQDYGLDLADKNILLTSAADRFGMASAFDSLGGNVYYGDLIFGLNLPLPIKSLQTINYAIKLLGPIISKLPFKLLYPTGSKQETTGSDRYERYYQWADIIAGDFHLIKKYLPNNLEDKIVITNTVTSSDIDLLQRKGVKLLITTTPELEGRSFGTNLLEAVFVSLIDKPFAAIKSNEYLALLDELDFKPRLEVLKS
ncbi:quinate 5-dehydrogenase [Sporohalobacter salinus]|uniref:quinate 5-dehydrogenase n=1 Tax=Sporohalobacter salinus TaxID=1494606 RepID=UPI0019617508|nr:quinate 5-dehydrogenase [Sporohalobacter salinus]MBM7625027.1 hypothetical protein [Sporohalobacter salinus]